MTEKNNNDSHQKKSRGGKRRYLSFLTALIPIALIIAAYGVIALTTQESNPFTIVTGISMTPTIPPGSVAVISKIPFDQLQKGDVIVFVPYVVETNGGSCSSSAGSNLVQESVGPPCFVIHRIFQIQNAGGQRIITTKGDDNAGPIDGYDTNINSSMYIGKVVLIMPYIGYLTVAPYNEYGVAVLVIAIVLSSLPFGKKPQSPTTTQASAANNETASAPPEGHASQPSSQDGAEGPDRVPSL
jgi:signal peptidase I